MARDCWMTKKIPARSGAGLPLTCVSRAPARRQPGCPDVVWTRGFASPPRGGFARSLIGRMLTVASV